MKLKILAFIISDDVLGIKEKKMADVPTEMIQIVSETVLGPVHSSPPFRFHFKQKRSKERNCPKLHQRG